MIVPVAQLFVPDLAAVRVAPAAGVEVGAVADQICDVYQEAFAEAPWNADHAACARFASILPDHLRSDGFRAALAFDAGRVIGFAYGFSSSPIGPSTPLEEVVAALVPPAIDSRLGLQPFALAEMAVLPAFQGRGVGGWLHDVLIGQVSRRSAWLLTSDEARPAARLYQSRGWRQIGAVDLPWSGEERTILACDLP